MIQYKNVTHNFTQKFGGTQRVIAMEIEITPLGDDTKRFKTFGIWDTGATSTVITKEVFDKLGLIQNGFSNVSTATESDVRKETYLTSVYLKADLRIDGIEVTVGTIAADKGIHCLIGMDIITQGDFSITNVEGKTCLSFRMPSLKEIDYYAAWKKEDDIIQAHFAAGKNMNTPCSCGNPKKPKFKNCHGKNLINS